MLKFPWDENRLYVFCPMVCDCYVEEHLEWCTIYLKIQYVLKKISNLRYWTIKLVKIFLCSLYAFVRPFDLEFGRRYNIHSPTDTHKHVHPHARTYPRACLLSYDVLDLATRLLCQWLISYSPLFRVFGNSWLFISCTEPLCFLYSKFEINLTTERSGFILQVFCP